ncbi:OLC1v1021398C1 [Oldenlandia corymbosa var. corymbosa]|uniref:OLC1v1021398C1 n=1 Tax=Oldenlandia corymbosa var. corymbosa TaxID=529605 RepID=A0AAV1BZ57_OLDCO|nr:OLC1v1021398C1 [Oldenlandia corymbosa var. corymbosa]
MNGLLLPLLLLLVSHAFVIAAAAASGNETAGMKVMLQKNHSKMSTFLIFGDSTVDPGNNNYIATFSKSNFPPYGKDFLNHCPTGRFTNGKLVTDFIAGYVGIKETVPPYLDPTLSIEDLKSGVSFASGGSGYDPVTAGLSSVIPLQQQLDYFREYKARIQQAIGKERANSLIKNAAFLISCGTNDYVVNYFSTPLRQYTYSLPQYQQLVLKLVRKFILGLAAEGAQRIVVVGLPPMGCLPIVITLNSKDAFNNRHCIEKFSSAARNYNLELQKLLHTLRRPNLELLYADIYTPLDDMITTPSKYGLSTQF